MKLLVTGGSGFIGANFIKYWLEKYSADDLVNLDALTYAGNPDNLNGFEKNSRYSFIKGNICDPAVVSKAIKGAEVVVHFAAETHVDRSILKPSLFLKTNILGTQILLEAAVKNKIRNFHHISTDEVYGSLTLKSKEKFNEKTRYNPRSPYAASKAAADHLVLAYHETYGLAATITNCSNNFGPYQHPEKLIPLAITNLLQGKKVPVYGDGQNIRDWLYVSDHCRAIDSVIKKGKCGEIYCVGGLKQDISNLEVIRKIVKLLNCRESQIEFVKDRPGHDRKYAIDWTKINRELGWQPEEDFEERLKETAEWYVRNEAWWRKLKGKNFQVFYRRNYKKL